MIRQEEDYILSLIDQLQKIVASVLKKNAVEEKEKIIASVDEGLGILKFSIQELKENNIEDIISQYPNTELLYQLRLLMNKYLEADNDIEIRKKEKQLKDHIEKTTKTCLFSDFYADV